MHLEALISLHGMLNQHLRSPLNSTLRNSPRLFSTSAVPFLPLALWYDAASSLESAVQGTEVDGLTPRLPVYRTTYLSS